MVNDHYILDSFETITLTDCFNTNQNLPFADMQPCHKTWHKSCLRGHRVTDYQNLSKCVFETQKSIFAGNVVYEETISIILIKTC